MVNTTKTSALQVRGENLQTNPEFTIAGTDRKMFSIEVNSVNASDANKTEGTWIRVTYQPTELGVHSARLIVSSYDGAKSRGIALIGQSVEKPVLHDVHAISPKDVTETSYVALWEAPENDIIDHYVVTRTIYPANAETYTDEQIAEEPYLFITGCEPGSRESYHVRSYRLGYYSDPSNEIYVDLLAGIDKVGEDSQTIPMGWRVALGGGLELMMPDGATVNNVMIYDLQGRLVMTLPEASNGYLLPLAPGGYIITAPNLATPLRVIF